MKRLIAIISIVTLAAVFTGCGKTETSKSPVGYSGANQTFEVKAEPRLIDKVVSDYQDGKWENEINVEDHHFEIINGSLYEDEINTGIYPDKTIGDVSFDKVIGEANEADGIIVASCDGKTIARFHKGKFINCADVQAAIPLVNERCEYFQFDHWIAVKFGQYVSIFDYLNLTELGQWEETEAMNNIIDLTVKEEGFVCSTFSNDNFVFRDGKLTKKSESHYTKFALEQDNDMIGISETIKEEITPNCKKEYAGTGSDGIFYVMYKNLYSDCTYTLFYRNEDSGETKLISREVTDAETTTYGCYYIEDGVVYYVRVVDGELSKTEVFKGTAYGLTPASSEEDAVCVVTTEKEANIHNSNGWDNLASF